MVAATEGDSSAQPPPWTRLLARFRDPSLVRSCMEILITAVPFAVLWIACWLSFHYAFWPGLVLIVPTGLFLMRLFMIQHDCGHGSFFRARSANDWVGRVLGVLTLTPYDHWRHTHALHHAGVGNLERRGIGDIHTLTVAEYQALGRGRRLLYRVYRSPLVLFGLGPAFLFLLQNRVPTSMTGAGWRVWIGPMATNAVTLIIAGLLIWLVGPLAFFAIHLPVALLAASLGVWLFYVQHQFEETSWEHDAEWAHPDASLHGSSYYDLPQPLRWFTANIGVHHVHHLNSRIPYYRLQEVLRQHPELKAIGRLTLMTSLRCVSLVLWDQSRKRLVSFRQMRLNAAADRREAANQPMRG
jgi:omega-6 fatty acid desaturase (delta-12 desaturase)